ncbi:AAA family ATPase [Nocardia sp. CA-135398]|uniref:AAA family ATPase n=1 Tax=Nocardia sp. CA-135398 TaxID=3239977 RepID=UPI003D951A4D
MRLHRLEMTAFGPFAETAVVDFDALGADGLFLLHGQTGAGKTTVLDAIAFALYGSVPGARGESKRLHSDHADEQTPPRVVLEATLGGRRVRLTRSPEFLRPSKRAKSGWVKENAAATLEWLDGRGANLARLTDIGDEIIRLLGMSADQFFQVVLLPQGDFARFLRAENEEREKLLEKLFDTERFGSAEQWLADRRRASAADVESRKQGIDRLIAQVAVAAGETAAEAVGPLEAVGWSQDLLATARAALTETAAEAERCQQESARIRSRAEEQRRLHELRRRMTAARERLDEYAATADHRADLQAELESARRAAPVAEAIDAARAAVMHARRKSDETHRIAARLAALLAEPAGADVAGNELITVERGPDGTPIVVADADVDAAIRRWSAQIGALDEVSADATTATRLTSELATLREEDTALTGRVDKLTRMRQQLPESIATIEARLRETTEAAATLPTLTAECERLQAAATAAVELAGRRTTLDHARIELESARAAHLDAKERVLDLRERRLAGMAAELAGQLTDGEPCTVCGSADHPAPARAAASAVSKDAEDAATAAERAAEDARDRVLARITDLEREIDALIARGGDADRVELAAALRAATDRYEDASELASLSDSLTAELSRLRTDESRLHDELRESDTRRSTVTTRIAAATARLTELTDRLRTAAGADETIDRRRARLDTLIGDATALRDARNDESAAIEQVTAIADRVESLALAAGFVIEQADNPIATGPGATPGRAAGSNASRAADLRDAASCNAVIDADGAGDADGADDAGAGDADGAGAGAVSKLTQRRIDHAVTTRGAVGSRSAEDGRQPRDDVALLTAYARVVTAATRTAQRQSEIEAELVAADRTRAHAEAVLAEPEIRAAASTEPGDLAELESAVAAAQTQLNAAVAAHAEAARRVNLLEDLGGQLWAAVDRIAPVQRAHEELAALAEVVAGRGENNRRMSLRSYVLAARLEEVALAGSVRLRRMSGGRYEFVHSDKAGPRGRRGGLGLDIRDDYTGAVRPAKTLSGGESFMAALSLALGLADTVAAESGGVVLDTIFIDEGFGGLDADTLDSVMGVLDELRAGGRVVGVVSHVDEMRQRIPSRLHVIRGRAGSQLRATVA